jgi:FkbM family methyltransferase
MKLRRWAERFSRGIVLRRRLPDEFRNLPIYVSPEAGLWYWRRNLVKVDPMLCRMARELVTAGSVVWDVGANVGLFTFSAAALAGRSGSVLAIEPDFWLVQLLTRSARRIQKNGMEGLRWPCWLPRWRKPTASASSRLRKEHERQTISLGHHGSSQAGGSRNLQPTVTLTLDFLLEHFPRPTVLKIGAEGAEIKTLRGASEPLRYGSSRHLVRGCARKLSKCCRTAPRGGVSDLWCGAGSGQA